jgi:phosphoribosylamine--glycine ligase
MHILITGSGGREHALAWKLKQSPLVDSIFVAPGNPGTALIAKNVAVETTTEIIAWARSNPVDVVVVGPDSHLAEGLVDALEKLGIAVFGPTKAAAEIEWSKSFAKQFMKDEGIPTAGYEIFTDIEKAKAHLGTQTFPLVIKASGLAFGKGVVIAGSLEEAEVALDEMMGRKIFGEAGVAVVIEEFLHGQEISVHAFCDGDQVVLFPPVQDHKRIHDGDQGPNTGGMGTVSPVPFVSAAQMKDIEEQVVLPTIQALKKRGRAFKGILFPGIMLTQTGPKVIEFNARFGDPETQSYMRILESDLVPILLACVQGTLKTIDVKWSQQSACCIVCASGGYPGAYQTGKRIEGLTTLERKDVLVFQAGTAVDGSNIVTNGGRVLSVTAVGDSLQESLQKAYEAVEVISFAGMQYRRDIGSKCL